jgi:hypothetical protein
MTNQTHSLSGMSALPRSIMSPRNTTASGRRRRAAAQLRRMFRSVMSLLICRSTHDRSG